LETVKDLSITIVQDEQLKFLKHKSLNRGMEAAKGEVIQFLDADTFLPPNFDSTILRILKTKNTIGGAFDMRFVEADLKLQLLSYLNSLRYRIWKTFYGDQAIFCLRESAIQVGGFPNTLMEAAHFCKALQKQGRLKLSNDIVKTSARRFNENGFWKVLWFDVKMWLRFVFHMDLKTQSTPYWKGDHS